MRLLRPAFARGELLRERAELLVVRAAKLSCTGDAGRAKFAVCAGARSSNWLRRVPTALDSPWIRARRPAVLLAGFLLLVEVLRLIGCEYWRGFLRPARHPPSRRRVVASGPAPSALGYTDAAPRGRRGLTQNKSYTPYASAQKRTPSSKEEKTGNRWRPPLNTLASVSSRFFKIYVSFDHRS